MENILRRVICGICEKGLLASSFPSLRLCVRLPVYPSVRMEQLGSHWADCHEIRKRVP
jgi:hypothetical protein